MLLEGIRPSGRNIGEERRSTTEGRRSEESEATRQRDLRIKPEMAVMPYPLYEKLLRQVNSSETIDVTAVCNTITNLSTTDPINCVSHYTEIFALIYHHGLLNGNKPQALNLYEGKHIVTNKGWMGKFEALPPTLQRIIAGYLLECAAI